MQIIDNRTTKLIDVVRCFIINYDIKYRMGKDAAGEPVEE